MSIFSLLQLARPRRSTELATARLYLQRQAVFSVQNIRPQEESWPDRILTVWSARHIAQCADRHLHRIGWGDSTANSNARVYQNQHTESLPGVLSEGASELCQLRQQFRCYTGTNGPEPFGNLHSSESASELVYDLWEKIGHKSFLLARLSIFCSYKTCVNSAWEADWQSSAQKFDFPQACLEGFHFQVVSTVGKNWDLIKTDK